MACVELLRDRRWHGVIFVLILLSVAEVPTLLRAEQGTVLGVKDARFTLDGKPTFLLGVSYYAALGAPDAFIRQDLDDMVRHGFHWLRVWATWDMFDHDISILGVGFVSPHRPRNAASPGQTAQRTRQMLAWMKKLGRVVPIQYQEPFRRGYGRWQPVASDFLADLRGARAGGAAGWCFHNGAQRTRKDQVPRRSFDMRRQRLFDQLDKEERRVVAKAANTLFTLTLPEHRGGAFPSHLSQLATPYDEMRK